MIASTFLVTKSSIWLTWVAASPRASATTTSTPCLAASLVTDCLIWLKKSAWRFATARPIFGFCSSQRWEKMVARPRITTIGPRTKNVERDMALGLLAAQDVEHDGERDDDADHDLLDERGHAHQAQPVAQDADDEHAERGAADRADAALQRRAADHDGRDRIELVARGGARLRRIQAHRQDHGGDAGEQAGGGVDGDRQLARGQAGEPGDLRAAAERVQRAA